MGKSKRKMLKESTTNEDPTRNDPSTEEGTHQPEETMVTPSKHKKHKKSKKKDQENLPEQPENPPEQPFNQAGEQKTDKKKKKKRKAEEESTAEEIKPPKVKKQKMDTADIPESVTDPAQVECAGHCSSEVVEEVSGEKRGEDKKKRKKKKKDHGNREDSSAQSGHNAVNTSQVEESPMQTGEDGDSNLQSDEVVKKEKKKKRKVKHHQSGEEADSSTQAECSSVNSSQGSPMETGASADGNVQSGEVRTKEKKKKKKGKDHENREDVDSCTQTKHSDVDGSQVERSTMETVADANDYVQSEESMNKEKKKKKKHKEKKSEQEPEKDMNELAEGCQQNGKDFSEKKKEKATKNKEKKTECEENNEQEDTAEEKKQRKKDKKKKSDESTTPVDNVEEVKQKKKDKKKKEKKDKSEETSIPTECSPNSKNVSGTVKEEKSSKKNRGTENMDESICKTETAVPDSNDCTDETNSKKKKKKKSKDKEHQDTEDDDPKAVSESTEINNGGQKGDSTSNPGEAQTNGNSAQAPFAGQWGTNLFKDNHRQNKFLRLLGGFKKGADSSQTATGSSKGLFGSLQGKENSSTGGQRALTYQAAQAMNRRLECDYERALSFSAKGQRGVGLGFQPDPAEGKKFHIDINKVSSKRFDAD